jgi:hypothetical protein
VGSSGARRPGKALEEENARLKRLVAEQALDNQVLKDLHRSHQHPSAGGRGLFQSEQLSARALSG